MEPRMRSPQDISILRLRERSLSKFLWWVSAYVYKTLQDPFSRSQNARYLFCTRSLHKASWQDLLEKSSDKIDIEDPRGCVYTEFYSETTPRVWDHVKCIHDLATMPYDERKNPFSVIIYIISVRVGLQYHSSPSNRFYFVSLKPWGLSSTCCKVGGQHSPFPGERACFTLQEEHHFFVARLPEQPELAIAFPLTGPSVACAAVSATLPLTTLPGLKTPLSAPFQLTANRATALRSTQRKAFPLAQYCMPSLGNRPSDPIDSIFLDILRHLKT